MTNLDRGTAFYTVRRNERTVFVFGCAYTKEIHPELHILFDHMGTIRRCSNVCCVQERPGNKNQEYGAA